MENLISNKKRNFVAEAEALGSAAKSRKGAIRFLRGRLFMARENRRLYAPRRGRSKFEPLHPIVALRRNHLCMSAQDWVASQEKRRSFPEAKRALHDPAFRKLYLARLRREEKRLLANPVPDRDRAFARLDRIARERMVATGKPIQGVPARNWRTSKECRREVARMAKAQGLLDNWDGSSFCEDSGDYFSLRVLDFAEAPDYHAVAGSVLGLVRHDRRRVYARRSDFRKSDRSDYYVVGRNEIGSLFLHQIPSLAVDSLESAMAWIWSGAEILARQGDVGIAASNLKKVEGENADIPVAGGHSRHRFVGEVYRNGSLHVRSGFLIHTGNQHPPIYLDGSAWRRIVVARRSERGMSTAD